MNEVKQQSSLVAKWLARLSRLLISISGLLLAAMMIHVFADVLLKHTISKPIPGTAEFVAHYYMVAAVFLPLPLVEIRNNGISVDLLYNIFGDRLRRGMLLFALVGQTVFFGLLSYQSSLDAWHSFEIKEFISSQIVIPIWPAAFFLPAGFALAGAVSVLRIVQLLTRSDWEEVCHHTNANGAIWGAK